jgi:phosphopantothenoylcysteine decarboxylase / phosphopantothenate---cysteine ligase
MLKGKSLLLGISGGIAAYKAAELVRLLVKGGAGVHVVMTANAQNFIAPLTLQTLSGNPVGTDLFNREYESQIGHIRLARTPDLIVLAPATANLIGKMAAGIADDYLTTILLATTAPILICPAMNAKMFEHPITQRNLDSLRALKYHILEPEAGELACKEEGIGRLVDLTVILETVKRLLTHPSLDGKRVLVSAGPTWEPFDPVRFISNPSSGKMGYALAAIAYRRGAEVYLVSGPSPLPVPHGVHCQKVITAHEMRDAILENVSQMDAVIMAAAVGDYRPLKVAAQKIKKLHGEENITLTKNPDILGHLGKSRSASRRPILVGFAAETENLVENATEKLVQKNLDFIVANNLTQSGSGFGCDTNQVKIIDRKGRISELPPMSKEEVAEQVFDRVETLLSDTES